MVNLIYQILKKLRKALESTQLSNFLAKIEAANAMKMLAEHFTEIANFVIHNYEADVIKALGAAESDRVPKVQAAAHEARKAWGELKEKAKFADDPIKQNPLQGIRGKSEISGTNTKLVKAVNKLGIMRQIAKMRKSEDRKSVV